MHLSAPVITLMTPLPLLILKLSHLLTHFFSHLLAHSLLFSLIPTVGAKSPASCMDLDAEKPMILHLIPRPSAAHTVPGADIQEEKEENNAAHAQKGG